MTASLIVLRHGLIRDTHRMRPPARWIEPHALSVSRSSVLSATTGGELARYLRPPAGVNPWPEVISQGVLDRFSKEKGPVSLTLVEPVVVEVSADVAWSGRSFRHSLRYLRIRPELPPDDVQLPDRLLRPR